MCGNYVACFMLCCGVVLCCVNVEECRYAVLMLGLFMFRAYSECVSRQMCCSECVSCQMCCSECVSCQMCCSECVSCQMCCSECVSCQTCCSDCVCPVKCAAVSLCPVKCAAVSVCPVKCVAVSVCPVKCADGSCFNKYSRSAGPHNTKHSVQNIGKVGNVGFSAGQKPVIKT
jgi:hypothetical protein